MSYLDDQQEKRETKFIWVAAVICLPLMFVLAVLTDEDSDVPLFDPPSLEDELATTISWRIYTKLFDRIAWPLRERCDAKKTMPHAETFRYKEERLDGHPEFCRCYESGVRQLVESLIPPTETPPVRGTSSLRAVDLRPEIVARPLRELIIASPELVVRVRDCLGYHEES